MERPMATLGFSYFLALVIASLLSLKIAMVLAALLFVAFVTGLFIKSIRKNRRIMTVLLAAMAAFSMYSTKEMLVYRPLQKYYGKNTYLRLETLDWVQENNSVTVRVVNGDLPKGTRLTLWLSGANLYPNPYDVLEGEFSLSTPKDSRNGQIRGYSKSRNISLYAYSVGYNEDSIELITPKSRPWMYKILQARRYAKNTVMSQPDMNDVAGLMIGIAFGFKDNLPTEIKSNFRAIGVSHLLAVSGLHVTVLSQAMLALLLFLKTPRKMAHVVAVIGVFLFMALTGFQPSILRAGLMCILFLFGQILGREPDSLNSLGLSVFAITVINPYAVNDLGLLLSFSATYGILVIYPLFQNIITKKLKQKDNKIRLFAKPLDSIGITLSATIPTLPVALLAFGQASLISPLANLLMVFPTSAVMITVCLAVSLYAIKPLKFLSTAFFWVGKMISRYLVLVSEYLSSIPMASIWASQLFVVFVIPAAIGLIVLGKYLLGKRGVRVMALWSAIALLCGVISYNVFMRGVTEITLLNAGNSTALLLSRNGYTGVVMLGDKTAVYSSVFELERRNVRTVDFLMIPDLNDNSAFSSIEFTKNINVNCLITGPAGEYSDTVNALNTVSQLSLEDGIINFWNDCYAEIKNGWLILKIGQTRILICPYKANAAELSSDNRLTNLLVITGKPPEHIASITAQAGVLNCLPERFSREIKAIPRISYPLYNTTQKNVTFYTRGVGDIKIKGGSIIEFE
jgi:competence protein ComEC